jgi:UDP-glucose 4-epimerase
VVSGLSVPGRGSGAGDPALTTVVVVGANGYIGSRLTAWLTAHPMVTLRPIVRRLAPFVSVEPLVIDLLDGATAPAALRAALDGADAVVHLAGSNEVAANQHPDRAVADTVLITQRIAAAAESAGVERVVYVSTVHVYGTRLVPGADVTEDLRPEPRHAYAVGRLASEHLLAGTVADPVIFRLTNSVGAPVSVDVDRWSLVTNDLCRQAVTTGTLRLRTSGTQWRDFVALSDVCAAIALAAGVSAAGVSAAGVPGAAVSAGGPSLPPGTYNLGSGRCTTVRQLAELIQGRVEQATGARPPLLAPPPEDGSPGPYTVSTDRLARAGWQATTPLGAAVDETLEFCLAHAGQLAGAAV